MKVYHGTLLRHAVDICNNGIDLNKSKKYLDFGRGFYVTPDIEMAKNMARRALEFEKRAKRGNDAFPAVMTFEYKECQELNYKKFEFEDINWAKFIMANRLTLDVVQKLGLIDSNADLKYDIIIGGTADGSVANIASNLRFGTLKPEEFELNLSDFLKKDGSSFGIQIVFCTERALSCIEYIKCDII
ncbi:MAG: DUF3990 domain-containing protein [Roseburia sp.]|nr:DUF3990 domain-containing protein [Roseburia sp.]